MVLVCTGGGDGNEEGFFYLYGMCTDRMLNVMADCCLADSTTAELPPGGLYRVKAAFKYAKEDADELSFEVGETICVIEYDDPEDQVSILSLRLV